MVEIGLLFVVAGVLVLFAMLGAAIVYVPKALSTEHEDEDDDRGGGHAV
jgi:hypothetical protein